MAHRKTLEGRLGSSSAKRAVVEALVARHIVGMPASADQLFAEGILGLH